MLRQVFSWSHTYSLHSLLCASEPRDHLRNMLVVLQFSRHRIGWQWRSVIVCFDSSSILLWSPNIHLLSNHKADPDWKCIIIIIHWNIELIEVYWRLTVSVASPLLRLRLGKTMITDLLNSIIWRLVTAVKPCNETKKFARWLIKNRRSESDKPPGFFSFSASNTLSALFSMM